MPQLLGSASPLRGAVPLDLLGGVVFLSSYLVFVSFHRVDAPAELGLNVFQLLNRTVVVRIPRHGFPDDVPSPSAIRTPVDNFFFLGFRGLALLRVVQDLNGRRCEQGQGRCEPKSGGNWEM